MTIQFNLVPGNLRVPFFSTEFASGNSQTASQVESILLIGQKLPGGSAAVNVPVQITNPAALDALFGQGSMLSSMGKASLQIASGLPTWAIPLSDNSAGVVAAGSITISGPATKAGILAVYIGGVQYQVAVASADTSQVIAAALVAALSADGGCFVTAAVDGTNLSKVNLQAKHKGEVCNSLDVRVNYYSDDVLPAGVTAAVAPLSGGGGNPSLTAAISGMGETQYDLISMPYTDAQSLTAIENELEDRWGPVRQNDGKLITAARGSFGTLATLGNSRNSKQDSIVDDQSSPSPLWVICASVAAAIALSAENDPAMPLQTLALPTVLAPVLLDRRTVEERNLLLYDGISSFKTAAGDQVVIERIITTYKTNALGAPDTSYLSLEKLLTLSLLRYEYNALFATKYARFKLGNDGTKYGPGQSIMTPKLGKSEIIKLYEQWALRGLVQDTDIFAANLIVERNATDPDRLDSLVPAHVMDQLRVMGTQIGFLV